MTLAWSFHSLHPLSSHVVLSTNCQLEILKESQIRKRNEISNLCSLVWGQQLLGRKSDLHHGQGLNGRTILHIILLPWLWPQIVLSPQTMCSWEVQAPTAVRVFYVDSLHDDWTYSQRFTWRAEAIESQQLRCAGLTSNLTPAVTSHPHDKAAPGAPRHLAFFRVSPNRGLTRCGGCCFLSSLGYTDDRKRDLTLETEHSSLWNLLAAYVWISRLCA